MRDSFKRSLAALLVVVAAGTGCSEPEDPTLPEAETAVAPPPTEPAAPAPARAYGDAIVFGSIGDASNLIPMLASDSASHEIGAYLFDGLLSYDKTLSHLEPRLAESWEVSEDGTVITFRLRKGLKWSDGDDFDVRDVKFAFDTIRDPDTLTSYAEDYKQVSTFEVLDDFTFRVTYDKPFAPALASWGNMMVLPSHLLEGKDINESELARKPVSLGSYTLEEWTNNTRLSLRANHDYYRGRPYIERVIYRVIPDQATQFLELKSGGLDSMGLTPLQYRRQTASRQFKEEFAKYRYVSGGYTYLGYNLDNPLFADVRVRRALTHAIDKQEIVDTVLLGLGSIAETPYRPGTDWINQKLVDEPLYPYDPDKARALFAEAGWKDTNGDGILDKDGKRFRFRILTNQGNDLRLKTATVIQRRLQEVGVEVEVRVIEWSAFLNDFVDKRNFEALVLGWSLSLDPDQYDIWHSTKTDHKQFNFVGFRNEEVDGLLEKGRRIFDTAERKAIYDRVQEIIAEEQPYTFLYVPDALPVVNARFHGIEEAPAGISWNFHEWYVPEGMQKYSLER
jgi:peptide/nickel transport system substrate-binding protein